MEIISSGIENGGQALLELSVLDFVDAFPKISQRAIDGGVRRLDQVKHGRNERLDRDVGRYSFFGARKRVNQTVLAKMSDGGGGFFF